MPTRSFKPRGYPTTSPRAQHDRKPLGAEEKDRLDYLDHLGFEAMNEGNRKRQEFIEREIDGLLRDSE